MTTLYVDNIAPNLQSTISAPNLMLPSKSILQVVRSTYVRTGGSAATSASYSEITPDYRVTITPKQANSKMLITFTYGAAVQASTRMGVKAYVSTDNFVTNNPVESFSHDESYRNDTSSYIITRGNTVTWYDAYSTTDTLYFSHWFNRGAGTGNARVNDNTGQAFVTVMEIAG